MKTTKPFATVKLLALLCLGALLWAPASHAQKIRFSQEPQTNSAANGDDLLINKNIGGGAYTTARIAISNFVMTALSNLVVTNKQFVASNLAVADLSMISAIFSTNNAQLDVSNNTPAYPHQFVQTYSGNGVADLWYNPTGTRNDNFHMIDFRAGIETIGDGPPTFQSDPLFKDLKVYTGFASADWSDHTGFDGGLKIANGMTQNSGSLADMALVRTNSQGVPQVIDPVSAGFGIVSPDCYVGRTNWGYWGTFGIFNDNTPGALMGVSGIDGGNHPFFGTIWGNSLSNSGAIPYAGIFAYAPGSYVPTDPLMPWVVRVDVNEGTLYMTNIATNGAHVFMGPADGTGTTPIEVGPGELVQVGMSNTHTNTGPAAFGHLYINSPGQNSGSFPSIAINTQGVSTGNQGWEINGDTAGNFDIGPFTNNPSGAYVDMMHFDPAGANIGTGVPFTAGSTNAPASGFAFEVKGSGNAFVDGNLKLGTNLAFVNALTNTPSDTNHAVYWVSITNNGVQGFLPIFK